MSNHDPLYNSKKADASDMSTGYSVSEGKENMKEKSQHVMDDASAKADEMANKVSEKASQVGHDGLERANEMAGRAQDRADEGLNKAGDAMDRGADMLRERGQQQGGTVGSVADTAADAMESAGHYLHDTNTGEMMDQVEAYIRKNPTQSLLIAAGVGFVLAKAFK